MRANQIFLEEFAIKNTTILTESKTYLLWESAGRSILEAQLTADQIQQLFQQIEQDVTAAGDNRTLLGKGKDAAAAVNKAWEDLKTKVQNSGPIKNVDAAYDSVVSKIEAGLGGPDNAVNQIIQKYRSFAKKHPIAQSLIYSALIAAAGISGAGLGGAAVLGLLKMTDKLLQGEKFSSAAYSGAKTGGMAYAAGQIGQAMKGKPDSTPTTGGGEGSYNSYAPPTNPDGSLMTPQEIAAAKNSLSQGAGNVASAGVSAVRQQAQQEALNAVQDAIAKGMDPSMTQNLKGIAQGAIDKFGTAAGGPISQMQIDQIALKAAMSAQKGVQESKTLTNKQINLIFEHVSDSIVLEGILDKVKGAAQTFGKNLTTKITADKLQSAWKAAGSPTDSDKIVEILKQAGVDSAVVTKVMSVMGITATQPSTSGASSSTTATQASSTTQQSVPATSNKTVTPTINITQIQQTLPKLRLRDLQSIQKNINATLAKRRIA